MSAVKSRLGLIPSWELILKLMRFDSLYLISLFTQLWLMLNGHVTCSVSVLFSVSTDMDVFHNLGTTVCLQVKILRNTSRHSNVLKTHAWGCF